MREPDRPVVWVVSMDWDGPSFRHSGGEPAHYIEGVFTSREAAEKAAEAATKDAEEQGSERLTDDNYDTWSFDVLIEEFTLRGDK